MTMKRALLRRDTESDHGTLGVLSARGLPGPLHVIEPPWRDNRRNRSRIPSGIYEVLPHLVAALPFLPAGPRTSPSAATSCSTRATSEGTSSRAGTPTPTAACCRE